MGEATVKGTDGSTPEERESRMGRLEFELPAQPMPLTFKGHEVGRCTYNPMTGEMLALIDLDDPVGKEFFGMIEADVSQYTQFSLGVDFPPAEPSNG